MKRMLKRLPFRLPIYMGPPNHMRYPYIDLALNIKGCDLVDTFGTDASCGPQFVSLKLTKVLDFVGNQTKAFKFDLFSEENTIPKFTLPFQYLIAYFVAVTCDDVDLCRYLESMFLIINKSGQVLILNHFKEPTHDRKSSSIFFKYVVEE